MFMTVSARALLFAMGASAFAFPVFAQNAPPAPAAAPEAEVVVVTGTREAGRTQFQTLAPVDVLSAAALDQTVSSEVGDALAATVPGFVQQRLPLADGATFVRPASLRNLSPDQTLVLVNGKRFHRSAVLGSRGAQAPDLAQIPGLAIKRIEVLRDGASAQYGSDAIAGVINIVLDTTPGFQLNGQVSEYFEGDGRKTQIGGQAGFEIRDSGFLVVSLELNEGEITSRSRQRPDAAAFQAANPSLVVPNPAQRWGQPELSNWRFGANFQLPINDTIDVYAFATLGAGEGKTDFNYRLPSPTANAAVYGITSVFPGYDLRTRFPVGFSPIFGYEDEDRQIVGGVRGGSEKFTWDFSVSEGGNKVDYSLSNTVNASLGPASPTSFKPGILEQNELNVNADFVYQLAVPGLAKDVNLAFGLERRIETYTIKEGERASWVVGPGAIAGLAPGSNGFPGFDPQQAGEWDVESFAGYVDGEFALTTAWTVGTAIRYEDFSSFGETVDGKIATRYEFTPDFAIRGSYSTGFRGPTPGQINSTTVVQGLDTLTGQIFNRGRLSSADPLAAKLGVKPLEPEESETISGGITWRSTFGLTGTIDLYRINVDNRFAESRVFSRAEIEALGPNPNQYTGVFFFINAFDTETSGIDIAGSYASSIGPGRLDLTAAFNFNETEVVGGTGSVVTSLDQKRRLEEGRGKYGATLGANYTLDKFRFSARARYYGSFADAATNSAGDIFQEIGAITFIDASVQYEVNENLTVRIGGENIFDAYPDEATFQANRGLIYTRNSNYDTDGGQYYFRVETKF